MTAAVGAQASFFLCFFVFFMCRSGAGRAGGVVAELRYIRVIDASRFEHAWTGDVLVAAFGKRFR